MSSAKGWSMHETVAIGIINTVGVTKTEVSPNEVVIIDRKIPGYGPCSLIAKVAFNRVDIISKTPESVTRKGQDRTKELTVVARYGPLNEGEPSLRIEDLDLARSLMPLRLDTTAKLLCEVVLTTCRTHEGPQLPELSRDSFWKTYLNDLVELTEVHLTHSE